MALSRLLESHPEIKTALDEGIQALLKKRPKPEGRAAVAALAHELKKMALVQKGVATDDYSAAEIEKAVLATLETAKEKKAAEAERRAKLKRRSRRASAVGATEYKLPGQAGDPTDMEAAAAAAVAAHALAEGDGSAADGQAAGMADLTEQQTEAAALAAAAALGGAEAAQGRSSSSGTAASDDVVDEEQAAKMRARARRGKRRGSVFDTGTELDDAWVPPVVEKSRRDWASILGHLASNALFGGLAEEQRRVLAHAMEACPFEAGEELIRQGDAGDYYYLVATGRCDVFVEGAGKVLEVGPGAGFGDLALLYDAPRAATVRGAVAGSCWRLDRATFKQVVVGMTRRRRELNMSFVRELDLFESLTEPELAAAADSLLTVDVRAGDVVLREGEAAEDAGARCFIVERGELMAEREGASHGGAGAGPCCPPLRKGSCFGELALLGGGIRAATVTASTDARLLAMDRATLLRLLPARPGQDDLYRARLEGYRRWEDGQGDEGLGAATGGAAAADPGREEGDGESKEQREAEAEREEATAEAGLAAASQEEGAAEGDLVAVPRGQRGRRGRRGSVTG